MGRRTGKPLDPPEAFWDASALVPLCVRQHLTARVLHLYKKFDAVVWWATPVEIASALARLVRMRELAPIDWQKSRKAAAELANEWSVIQPSDVLRTKASELVDRYHLRAADALQLAAALEWCKGAPQGEIFLTTDERLRDAAILTGFGGLRIDE